MRTLPKLSLALLLVADMLAPGPVPGLTIYRIGGDGLAPPPEAGLAEVAFVRRSWEAAAQGAEGGLVGIELADDRIAPLRLRPDENLAASAEGRGGGPWGLQLHEVGYPRPFRQALEIVDPIADGDPTTAFGMLDGVELGWVHFRNPRLPVITLLELGARFPVNRIRFYPATGFPERRVDNYSVMLHDGEFSEVVTSVTANRQVVVDARFPTRFADWVWLEVSSEGLWEIAELEVYGEGYVAEAAYRSAVLDLGAPATLGPLRWAGSQDHDARVMIRTRSGADEDPNRYWRLSGRGDEKTYLDEQGQPLTRAAFENLAGGKAEITADLDNWSGWSGSYDFADSAGSAMVSSSPRRFVQLQVEFLPRGLHGGGVEVLEFWTTQPPVSGTVVGELWPVAAEPGEVTPFIYALRAEVDPGMSGFDQLVLETSGSFAGIDSVRINGVTVAHDLVAVGGQRLVVGLPRIGATQSRKLVEVFFRAQVFYFGTVFQGQVLDSERPLEVGQLIEPGDASFRFESSQQWVGTRLGGGLLRRVAVRSTAITPNGDGTNDRAHIEYTLMKLAQTGRVRVDIFDLSGRPVRQLHRGQDPSGSHAREWDGRGEDGRVVSPGLYLYRVRVDADEGRDERGGVIAVAY